MSQNGVCFKDHKRFKTTITKDSISQTIKCLCIFDIQGLIYVERKKYIYIHIKRKKIKKTKQKTIITRNSQKTKVERNKLCSR